MINSRRWQLLRAEILRNHPLCVRCESNGEVTSACEVHHKTPVDSAVNCQEKERLMFNPGNLMAVCHRCHIELHMELGRSGSKKHAQERKEKETKDALRRFFGVE